MSPEVLKTRCPICKAPSTLDFKPFCSRGCRDKDLLAWMGEGYRIAGKAGDDELQKSSDYGLDNEDGSAL
jgi:uncharacterized protein